MKNNTLFDPLQYKLTSKANWNVIAPLYHHNWADKNIGPFRSTSEMVRMAKIEPQDTILDLACGTGAVSKEVSRHLGNDGLLVSLDLSRTALSIAKTTVPITNRLFIEMDAENIGLNFCFDKIFCQYALMFFPDVDKVLKSLRKVLKNNGVFFVAVHGLAEDVPYFSCIMKPITKYIPDIRPTGSPTPHRFGDPEKLKTVLTNNGFADITINKLTFSYDAGTFEEYWEDYIHSTANSIWSKIEKGGPELISKIRSESEENASKYLRGIRIVFPWVVLVAKSS